MCLRILRASRQGLMASMFGKLLPCRVLGRIALRMMSRATLIANLDSDKNSACVKAESTARRRN